MRHVALALVAGCAGVSDDGGPWQDAASITGELAPEIGPPPAPRDAPCTIRVASWNVHFAPDPDDLAAQIASSELATADIVMTQEIRAYPDEPATRAHRLADALGMTWVYAPARTVDTGTHGLALMSRFPLEAPVVRRLPYIDQPLNPEQRIALAADVVLGDQRLHVVVVHLDVRIDPADRIRQLHPAVNDIPDAALLGGDFNTAPWSFADDLVPLTSTDAALDEQQARIVDDYLGDNRFAGAISPGTATMRIPVFSMRLDNLYARDFAIAGSGAPHVDGSDHWPVWFDVDRCGARADGAPGDVNAR